MDKLLARVLTYPRRKPGLSHDVAKLFSASQVSAALAVLAFVGFGVASAVVLGQVYGQLWLTVAVILVAVYFAR